MKKKMLSLLLVLTMVLVLAPAMGFTVRAEEGIAITENDFTEGALTISDDGDYYLDGNVTGKITIAYGAIVTLDLNGFMLKGAGSSVIVNKGTLTIQDTGSEENVHYYTVDENGLWNWDDGNQAGAVAYENLTARPLNGSVIAVKGGAVTGGNNAENGGGGIYSVGVLKLVSGNIIGNAASGIHSPGGGLCARFGTVELSGGFIGGNIAYEQGGGVFIGKGNLEGDPACVFTMSGGHIEFNSAASCGSAISTNTYGRVMLLGGSIAYNHVTAPDYPGNTGGAVEVWSTENPLILGGEIAIMDNTSGSDDKADNLLLDGGNTVSVSREKPVTGSAKIGVTLVDGTGPVTNANNTDYSGYFISDNPKLIVSNTGDASLAVTVTSSGDITEVSSGKTTIEMPARSSYNSCPQDETCVYAQFSDAYTKAWYHSGVHFCVENGYMTGVSPSEFAPSEALSRAMIVAMLWNMEGQPVVDYAMTFSDVTAGQWYTEAIRWAQSVGVVKGYDEGRFGPENEVTREQMAAILMQYAAFKGMDVSARADLDKFLDARFISSWAVECVRWANAEGILNGSSSTMIAPADCATRAEAAAMILQFCRCNVSEE